MIINKKALDKIIEEAKTNYPNEICGILAGLEGKAEEIYFLKNISKDPTICYEVDPLEQLALFKHIRKEGKKLVGIFHSHSKTEAYPSKRDIELAFYPEAEYLIVSLKDINAPEARCFRILSGEIQETTIEKEKRRYE